MEENIDSANSISCVPNVPLESILFSCDIRSFLNLPKAGEKGEFVAEHFRADVLCFASTTQHPHSDAHCTAQLLPSQIY